MNIIKASIQNPVATLVGVILVVLFGTIGLLGMPYQLSPDVTEPEITVRTLWPGATPYEVERDIIEEQEKVLKSIPGLVEMESSARNNMGEITLTFKVGTSIQEAMLRTSNKLDEVLRYPENVEKPVISASGANTSPAVRLMLKTLPENENDINTYRTFLENEIRQYLERIEGVSELQIFGGTESEMHVIVDPGRMASFGVTVDDIIQVLDTHNVNVSAGDLDLSRRSYRIRTIGEFKTPVEVEGAVIKGFGDRFVRVGDVANVDYGYQKLTTALMFNGENGIHVGVVPQVGVNVLDLSDRTEEVVNWLNSEKLKPRGLVLEWAYEQRPYITGAIDLVRQNIFIGGLLAVLVLLLFLRSITSTLIIGFAIPISVVGTFIFLYTLGRNLNVISLAGISFSVGMLVDNAIVVLENIDRHRQMGKAPFQAAHDGAREVWGAVLASTLTTVAVFLPVVFIQEEAGQLFKDIAIAVTCAILLSLVVSVAVIPMLANRLYSLRFGIALRREERVGSAIVDMGNRASEAIMSLVRFAMRNWLTRLATALGMSAVAVLIAYAFFPKLEYLPQGNQNLIMNILITPPGLSYEERHEMGVEIKRRLDPLYGEGKDGLPGIKRMFYVSSDAITIFGVVSTQEQRAAELIPFLSEVTNSFPGIYGVSVQRGIFESGIGEGRNVNVDISGTNIEDIAEAAAAMFGQVMNNVPGVQVRPVPSFELLYPEVRFIPDPERLKSVEMDVRDLGIVLDVLMDGRDIGDFKPEGEKKIDLILKASSKTIQTPEDLYNALVVTHNGHLVPVSSLAELRRTTGITEIRHLELDRTITLQVTPPRDMPVQECIEIIETNVIGPMQESGLLEGVEVELSGTADKLFETWNVLRSNFVLALIITYLLMSALFGNFLYPFIIMFTVPLAAAGGFLGLKLVNWLIAPQPLDVLTMLGFVMLIGVVVNNAILIVHQSLNNVRDHRMGPVQAVEESVRTRLRPIYMSATTSILGMLPLVIFPGPGSEMYRGLGSVMLGGLALSTVFTVFLIPVLLVNFIKMEKYNGEAGEEEEAEAPVRHISEAFKRR